MNIKNIYAKFVSLIDMIEEWILVILLTVAMIVGTWQVAARYIFHSSLPWSEELLRMSFVWCSFIGASLGMSRDKHLSVDFFINLFPKAVTKVLNILSKFVTLVFSVIMTRYTYEFWLKAVTSGQKTTAMEIPYWIPYLALLLSFFLMIFQLIQVIIKVLSDKQEDLDVLEKSY